MNGPYEVDSGMITATSRFIDLASLIDCKATKLVRGNHYEIKVEFKFNKTQKYQIVTGCEINALMQNDAESLSQQT